MVREFQKHTDGSPIPRSDIGDRAKQVDSRAVSPLRHVVARFLSSRIPIAGFLLSRAACISRENAIDPVSTMRNSPLSSRTFGEKYRILHEKKKKNGNFVSCIFLRNCERFRQFFRIKIIFIYFGMWINVIDLKFNLKFMVN